MPHTRPTTQRATSGQTSLRDPVALQRVIVSERDAAFCKATCAQAREEQHRRQRGPSSHTAKWRSTTLTRQKLPRNRSNYKSECKHKQTSISVASRSNVNRHVVIAKERILSATQQAHKMAQYAKQENAREPLVEPSVCICAVLASQRPNCYRTNNQRAHATAPTDSSRPVEAAIMHTP